MNEELYNLLQSLEIKKFQTSTELAKTFGVSSKTIRKRIRDLSSILSPHGAVIELIPSKGAHLIVSDRASYHLFLQEVSYSQEEVLAVKKNRVLFIMDYLLLSKGFVNLDSLSRKLFISRSTLSNDLVEVRDKFNDFKITIENHKKKGVRLDGREVDIRRCYASISNDLGMLHRQNEDALFDQTSQILKDVLHQYQFYLSDIGFDNLSNHLYIMIKRFQQDLVSTTVKTADFELLLDEKTIEISREIANKLETQCKVHLPEEEIILLAIHLAGKQNVLLNQEVGNQKTNRNLQVETEIANEMTMSIFHNWAIDLREDEILKQNLLLHIGPLLIRVASGFEQSNPLLFDITQQLSLAYCLAIQAVQVLEAKTGQRVSRDEVGFIALHFSLALERKRKNLNQKSILIVCSTGRGTSELLAYRVREAFGGMVKKVKVSDLVSLATIPISTYDLILSTVTITEPVPIPIVQISPLLKQHEIEKIRSYISNPKVFLMKNFFTPSLFITDIEGDSREIVLKQMVNKIATLRDIPDDFYQLVLEREALGSTDYGNLIAIPHPNKLVSNETFICIGLLKKPILWQNNTVQLVMLISIQKEFSKDIEMFYRVISHFIMDEQSINRLIEHQTYTVFLEELALAESKINQEE